MIQKVLARELRIHDVRHDDHHNALPPYHDVLRDVHDAHSPPPPLPEDHGGDNDLRPPSGCHGDDGGQRRNLDRSQMDLLRTRDRILVTL